MPDQRANKVIIDTNLWISFLIGKELQYLKDLIINEQIKLITTDQLLNELELVTSREKLKKYFNQEDVRDLILLLDIVADKTRLKRLNKFVAIPRTIFCWLYQKRVKLIF